MALRRMFSKAVVSSARFMKMPVDSQNLYFHLGMAADDDGVVEAWSVLKTVGSAEDNLKVLASKGFIRVLNEDLVSYILDWNEHNLLRADRISPSAYRELLVQMIPDVHLEEPKQRADRPLRLGRPGDSHGTAEGRIGEGRIGEIPVAIAPFPVEEVDSFEGIDSETTRVPKVKADPLVEKAAKYWQKLCQQHVGQVPTGGVSKGMWKIKEARKHLSFTQIKQMMDEWFETESQEPHEMIQITRCLSSFRIDKYVAENA